MAFDSCKGVIGRWLIYETMPRYIPPSVRFRYGNNPWQTISPANSYKITPIYDPSKWYYVRVAVYSASGLCGYYNSNVISYSNFFGVKGDFHLRVFGFGEENNPFNGDGLYKYKVWGLSNNNNISNLGISWEIYEGCKASPNPYGWYSNTPPWISDVYPIDDATINYLLEIFYENNLVFSETSSIKPDVEILPETCKYFGEDKKLVNTYYNNNPNNFMSLSTIGNTSIVWLLNDWSKLLPPRPEPFYILYKGTSDCNLPPKIDTECVPECIRCPNGTCAVICGNNICCYNNDGVAVLSIPKERYCNE